MDVKTELAALADRCEAATGPDRELDFYIWAALNGVTEITNPAEGHPMTPGRGGRVEGRDASGELRLYGFVDPGKTSRNWSPYGGDDRYPAYTASLDAAMSLVPEGWEWRVASTGEAECWCGDGSDINLRAATPALALCAAALRARNN